MITHFFRIYKSQKESFILFFYIYYKNKLTLELYLTIGKKSQNQY